MNPISYDASEVWKKELSVPGSYEHHCFSEKEANKLARLGQVWRRVFQATGINAPARLFELGCGGGIHLGTLALNGFDVHGIDVSEDVARRAKSYIGEISEFKSISATVETADIFTYEATNQPYDMCFHFGVVEHFLNDAERHRIWCKLKSLTKPGGWIVSVVPCGQHVMRSMVREQGLGGYNVPEIDYSCKLHREEFRKIGLTSVRAFAHSYFSFLSCHPSKFISKLVYPPLFLTSNTILPALPLPEKTAEKWAQTLIVIGKKEH